MCPIIHAAREAARKVEAATGGQVCVYVVCVYVYVCMCMCVCVCNFWLCMHA